VLPLRLRWICCCCCYVTLRFDTVVTIVVVVVVVVVVALLLLLRCCCLFCFISRLPLRFVTLHALYHTTLRWLLLRCPFTGLRAPVVRLDYPGCRAVLTLPGAFTHVYGLPRAVTFVWRSRLRFGPRLRCRYPLHPFTLLVTLVAAHVAVTPLPIV